MFLLLWVPHRRCLHPRYSQQWRRSFCPTLPSSCSSVWLYDVRMAQKCPGTIVLCVVSHWMQCSVWYNTLLSFYFDSLRFRELSQIRISSLPCCAVHHGDISKEAPVISEVERVVAIVILHSLEMSRLHFTDGLGLQIHSLNWATCYLHRSCVIRVSSEHSRQLRKSGKPCARWCLTPSETVKR